MRLRPALFLDRDGVINIDRGYVYRIEDFEFIEGIFDLCRIARELGYLIIVVTNQAGIGRGYYTEQDFLKLTDWMCDVFKRNGAVIDGVFHCPYHPRHGVGQYKKESADRKPAPGMILQAVKKFDVDVTQSVLVGDKASDVEAGVAAGIGCNLLLRAPGAPCPEASGATALIGKLSQAEPFLRMLTP